MTPIELRDLVQGRPDAYAECDQCHDDAELWTLDEPGEYQLCQACIGRMIRSKVGRLDKPRG